MKLWVDDLRDPPDDSWTVARTSQEALTALETGFWSRVSLDHDLGGEDTTRPVIRWLCENPRFWPTKVVVHTANPVGRRYLTGMINRYHPGRDAT